MSTLAELQVASTGMLKTLLRARVGVKRITRVHLEQPLSHYEYNLHLDREEVQAQVHRLQEQAVTEELNATVAAADSVAVDDDDEDTLLREIDQLKAELLDQTAAYRVRTGLLDQLRLGQLTDAARTRCAQLPHNERDQEGAAPATTDAPSIIPDRHTAQSLVDAADRRDILARQLAHLTTDLADVTTQRRTVQLDLSRQHAANRQLLTDIRAREAEMIHLSSGSSGGDRLHGASRASSVGQSLQQLDEELAKLIARQELIRNVLQGLILESGVDWSRDKFLQETLLMLGETE
ncbi:hypothetical protein IWQ60_010584 [Tieghemiomyces parasiticus]|uniref:Centromere protein H C-terminal domain-containing protein n=1 Tax=Tieghemiomyces parasiticus TaxID=78921 RepID=A0A9W7ZKR9_9FUNG|nr:hypothetical protein IWQ60_010584 [Tieghemiomyces parasiticus]